MGLLELFGAGENPFYQAFDQNRGKVVNGFAGLVGAGNDPRQALTGWTKGMLHGRDVDTENALIARQEAEQKAAQDAETAKQNQTIEWLRQNAPEYADAVANGAMTASDAWNTVLQSKQPKSPIKAAPGDVFLDPTTYQPMSTIPKPADPYTLGQGQVRFGGDNQPLATGPTKTPDTIINNSMGGTDKFYETLDADLAKQVAANIETGITAQSNNMRLGQIETLLQTAPQGAQGAMTQIASSLGIPVSGASEVQAAQALINQLVPGQRPPGSGTMSDADLALFKASLPAIINQPGGNALILQTAKAINEYYIAQASIAQQVANREISPAQGRQMQAQVPNPLANFSTGAPKASAPVTDLGNGITIQEIP
jgi:hypothetical protein